MESLEASVGLHITVAINVNIEATTRMVSGSTLFKHTVNTKVSIGDLVLG